MILFALAIPLCRRGVHRVLVMAQKFCLFESDRRCILPKITRRENPAGQLLVFAILNSSQEAHTDLRLLGDFFKCHTALLPPHRQIQKRIEREREGLVTVLPMITFCAGIRTRLMSLSDHDNRFYPRQRKG